MRTKQKIHDKFAPGTPTIKATQLDVAIRQLVQAIQLFFFDGDPVSTYSLARNAEEILSTLLKIRGEKSLWNKIVEMVKPERQEEFRKMIDGSRNAFKHKVVDENEIVEMPLEMNEFFLLVGAHAIHWYWFDSFKQHPELLLFEGWYVVHHPDVLIDADPGAEMMKAIASSSALKSISKKEYFNSLYEAVSITLK